MSRFRIHCTPCGDDVDLIQMDDSDYLCTVCGTKYDDESGVIDLEVAEYYRKEYARGLVPSFLSNEDLDIIDNKIDAYDLRENK